MKIETSLKSFFKEDSSHVNSYNEFLKNFGGNPTFMVGIKTPTIFTPKNLEKLTQIHNDIEKNLDFKKIESLVNVPIKKDASKPFSPLGALFPNDTIELSAFQTLVSGESTLQNRLISKNGDIAAILITPNSFAQTQNPKKEGQYLTQLNKDLMDLTQKYTTDEFSVFVIGSSPLSEYLKKDLLSSTLTLLLGCLAIICLILIVLFRRVSGVLLPIFTVISACIWTLALMALTNTPISQSFQLLPAFLIVVGVCYPVHYLSRFYTLLPNMTKDSAIKDSLNTCYKAIVAAGLTTAIGLFSFCSAPVTTVFDLGLFSGISVLFIIVFSLTIVPSVLALIPLKTKSGSSSIPLQKKIFWLLDSMKALAITHPKAIVLSILVLIILFSLPFSRLKVEHNGIKWLPHDLPLRVNTETVNTHLNGLYLSEIIIDTRKPNGVIDQKFLDSISAFQTSLKNVTVGTMGIGYSLSIVDILQQSMGTTTDVNGGTLKKELNDLLASDRDIHSIEIEQIYSYVDPHLQSARIQFKSPWVAANRIQRMIDSVQTHAEPYFPGCSISITGKPALLVKVANLLSNSLVQGYLIAFILIFLMIYLSLKDIRLSLIAIIPNVLPVIVVLGIIGYFNIPIDIYLLPIGTIILSISVDDTLHMFIHFQKQYTTYGNVKKAVIHSIDDVGLGLFYTSVIVISGFGIFMISEFNNLFIFGLLISVGSLTAFIADVLLAPALLICFVKDRPVK
ncbi:MAG: MMPL family transporter [Reichenbachiella sp.]